MFGTKTIEFSFLFVYFICKLQTVNIIHLYLLKSISLIKTNKTFTKQYKFLPSPWEKGSVGMKSKVQIITNDLFNNCHITQISHSSHLNSKSHPSCAMYFEVCPSSSHEHPTSSTNFCTRIGYTHYPLIQLLFSLTQ